MKISYLICYINCFVLWMTVIIKKNLDEHIRHLKLIFERLHKYNLKIQLDKSEFHRNEDPYHGHVITPQGIKPIENKSKAIKKFPIQKTQKEIKSFLALLGY